MAKRGRPAKEKFADLPAEFKDGAASMQEQEIRDLVAKVAMQEEENKKLMKEDQQLKEARFAAKEAGQQYKDATKMNTLKIQFLKDVLDGRGKVTT